MGLAPAFVGAIYLEGFFNEVSFGLVSMFTIYPMNHRNAALRIPYPNLW